MRQWAYAWYLLLYFIQNSPQNAAQAHLAWIEKLLYNLYIGINLHCNTPEQRWEGQ